MITLQDDLSKVLDRFEGVIEIYASTDYVLGDENPTWYVLHGGDKYDHMLWKLLYGIMECQLVFVTDVFSPLFNGKRIIWRKGRWYL